MNIDQQLQQLIDEAPNYGVSTAEVRAIAPAFKAIAGQLKHPQYYILQTLEQNWLVTTLNHRTQPDVTLNVVHAFPTLKDATASASPLNDPQILALPVPVIFILFQMLAMNPVNSIIFFETPGNFETGVEISRPLLEEIIRLQVQGAQSGSQIPPDIA